MTKWISLDQAVTLTTEDLERRDFKQIDFPSPYNIYFMNENYIIQTRRKEKGYLIINYCMIKAVK